MKTHVTARVQVTIELNLVNEHWTNESTVEQVHREGAQMAVDRVEKMCQRYVRLIGKPRVEAITTLKDR